LTVNGRVEKAHRVAWRLTHVEPLADEIHVLHKCDVPECVNPDHLFLGTQPEDVADMVRKDRQQRRRGADSSRAKLTTGQAAVIRAAYAAGGVTMKQLAALHNVHDSQICRLIHGDSY